LGGGYLGCAVDPVSTTDPCVLNFDAQSPNPETVWQLVPNTESGTWQLFATWATTPNTSISYNATSDLSVTSSTNSTSVQFTLMDKFVGQALVDMHDEWYPSDGYLPMNLTTSGLSVWSSPSASVPGDYLLSTLYNSASGVTASNRNDADTISPYLIGVLAGTPGNITTSETLIIQSESAFRIIATNQTDSNGVPLFQITNDLKLVGMTKQTSALNNAIAAAKFANAIANLDRRSPRTRTGTHTRTDDMSTATATDATATTTDASTTKQRQSGTSGLDMTAVRNAAYANISGGIYSWLPATWRSFTLGDSVNSVYPLMLTTNSSSNYYIYAVNGSNDAVVIQSVDHPGWYLGVCTDCQWGLTANLAPVSAPIVLMNTTASDPKVVWQLLDVKRMSLNTTTNETCSCTGVNCGKCIETQFVGYNYTTPL